MTSYDLDQLYIFLGKVGLVIMVLPILAALLRYKFLTKALVVFMVYRIFAVLFNLLEQGFIWLATNRYDLIKSFVENFEIKDTSFLAILFQLNNFFFLGLFYALILSKSIGSIVRKGSYLFIIAVIINFIFIEGYHGFGKFNPNATTFFTIGIALLYLWYLYKASIVLPLKKNPYFWLSISLIFPYLISAIYFMVNDVSHEENYNLFITMSIVKNAFLMVGQIFMVIGFLYAQNAKYVENSIKKSHEK